MVSLEQKYIDEIKSIFSDNLKSGYKVAVFGSRATGKNRKFSDVDLLIIGNKPLSLTELALLDEQFELSSIPYTIDLVDKFSMNKDYLRLAEKEMEIIYG